MEIFKSQSSESVFLQQATEHFMQLPDDSYLLKEINTQSWKEAITHWEVRKLYILKVYKWTLFQDLDYT